MKVEISKDKWSLLWENYYLFPPSFENSFLKEKNIPKLSAKSEK